MPNSAWCVDRVQDGSVTSQDMLRMYRGLFDGGEDMDEDADVSGAHMDLHSFLYAMCTPLRELAVTVDSCGELTRMEWPLQIHVPHTFDWAEAEEHGTAGHTCTRDRRR
jgi:hypothetical protein